MDSRDTDIAANRRIARRLWADISPSLLRLLSQLTEEYNLSIANGELLLLNGRWYVTHAGLLGLSRRNRCAGIVVKPVERYCNPSAQSWTFEATVYKSKACRGFVGYGDADPSNVSPLVRGAEMRVAETRAVNRALRKAYGIGLCSAEEVGARDGGAEPLVEERQCPRQREGRSDNRNGSGNSRPRVRDRLCQLIRHYQLDAELVKAYGVNYCGTRSLREASRSQVEQFVQHLAEWAQRDRSALLCKLNSYPRIAPISETKDQAKEDAA